MLKQVSNIANRERLENEMGVPFKYPKLYVPNPVIDGNYESTLSVITLDNPDYISFAIWGILPFDYYDDWKDFQKVLQTITTTKDKLSSDYFFEQPYQQRRCLVVVTGFFIYHLYQGSLHPYYVYLENQQPFCMGGIYNTLSDGFITSSILLTESKGIISKIQNLNNTMPLVIPKEFYQTWLDSKAPRDKLDTILDHTSVPKFRSHPIAKEFFKNDIAYTSMLDPVYYKNIPIP
ncbi:SOS response-associated peptidase [Aquimarina spongiae]|uniref:Abasic site processing protein n=1 Tax=Aquimarina spongiae TaxID=570521 RepID=A0A1M6GLY9_9FLAO|nr:SOS response-associated peptidase family protein [Aquimarina spongiae]SHJ10941.1 Putative SOS response-associated peptidase YedK [Aquimarina spongiae]